MSAATGNDVDRDVLTQSPPAAAPLSSLRNFSFALRSCLAGSDAPTRQADFQHFHDHGVRAIVNVHALSHAQLYDSGADAFAAEVVPFGFRTLHLPVEDFTPPSPPQLAEGVAFIRQCLADRLPVVVHCRAGIGRSGTLMACAMLSLSAAATGDCGDQHTRDPLLVAPMCDARAWAEQTVLALRSIRPESVETPEQLAAIVEWARTLLPATDSEE